MIGGDVSPCAKTCQLEIRPPVSPLCYNSHMENVISVENMRKSDEHTIATSVPSLELMRRAAEGIRSSHDFGGSTLIVVGSGNNGGDGFALAEILLSEGKDVTVLSVTDHYSKDSAYYMERCKCIR